MSRLRSLYHKFVEEIKGMGKIPHYNYEKVLKQIQHASYPASLGMINLVLYQYVKSIESQFANPDIFFLIASILFFFISVLIGLGSGNATEEPLSPAEQELKYRQAFIIVICFSMAILLDFLGLMFLAVMHIS